MGKPFKSAVCRKKGLGPKLINYALFGMLTVLMMMAMLVMLLMRVLMIILTCVYMYVY